jgi:hypothetical protein
MVVKKLRERGQDGLLGRQASCDHSNLRQIFLEGTYGSSNFGLGRFLQMSTKLISHRR